MRRPLSIKVLGTLNHYHGVCTRGALLPFRDGKCGMYWQGVGRETVLHKGGVPLVCCHPLICQHRAEAGVARASGEVGYSASRALCAMRLVIFFAHSFVVSFIMVWYGVWCALLQMVPIVVAMGTVGCALPTYILLFGSSQNLTKISQTHQSTRFQPNLALMPNYALCHGAARRNANTFVMCTHLRARTFFFGAVEGYLVL